MQVASSQGQGTLKIRHRSPGFKRVEVRGALVKRGNLQQSVSRNVDAGPSSRDAMADSNQRGWSIVVMKCRQPDCASRLAFLYSAGRYEEMSLSCIFSSCT